MKPSKKSGNTRKGKANVRRNGTNDVPNVRTTVTDMTVTVATSAAVRVEKSSGNVMNMTTTISAADQDTTGTGTTIDVGISADETTSSVLSDVGTMMRTIEETETSADEEEEMMKSDGYPITLFLLLPRRVGFHR